MELMGDGSCVTGVRLEAEDCLSEVWRVASWHWKAYV